MAGNHYGWEIGKALPTIGEHSLAKHRILDRYLRRYIEICTSQPRMERLRLSVIDGFAGGGRYQFLNETRPGSPIILLQAISDMQDKLNSIRPKGFEVDTNFVFIDDKKKHTDFLRAEIEQSAFASLLDKKVHVINRPFGDCVDGLILSSKRHTRTGRALFILDQYGWSNVVFEDVRKILQSLPKAEVFLNFSVDALINYMSEQHIDHSSYKRIELDPGFVKELLELKGEEAGWRTIIQNELYGHIQQQTGAEFYSPFFVKSLEASRSYWLLHLSRHREARNEIGKIHWSESNVSLHHGGAGLGALGFAPGRDPAQYALDFKFDASAHSRSLDTLSNQIPERVYNLVESGTRATLETLFGNHCNDTPVTLPIVEDALALLRDDAEIKIISDDGKARPRAKTFSWTDEVVLPPQRTMFGPFAPKK